MLLVMTVEPGFGGQSFMPEMLPKIKRLREFATNSGLDTDIQVDGGIDATTAPLVIEAGANVLVAGSSIFSATDYKAAIKQLTIDS
jgi:ribulose-phosphate 3-epimerase